MSSGLRDFVVPSNIIIIPFEKWIEKKETMNRPFRRVSCATEILFGGRTLSTRATRAYTIKWDRKVQPCLRFFHSPIQGVYSFSK